MGRKSNLEILREEQHQKAVDERVDKEFRELGLTFLDMNVRGSWELNILKNIQENFSLTNDHRYAELFDEIYSNEHDGPNALKLFMIALRMMEREITGEMEADMRWRKI